MLRYPECDATDCWYRQNPDRINEYSGNTTFVCGVDDSLGRKDLCGADRPPYQFSVCNMCYFRFDDANTKECSLCARHMYDEWITVEDQHYCRLCISDKHVLHYLTDLCGGNDSFIVFGNTMVKEVDVSDWIQMLTLDHEDVIFHTSAGDIHMSILLSKVVQQRKAAILQAKKKEEELKLMESKKEEEVGRGKRKRNMDQLTQLFGLEHDDDDDNEVMVHLNYIVSRHLKEKGIDKLPEFKKNKRAQTLLWLLERPRSSATSSIS